MGTLTYQQRNALASSSKGAITPVPIITGPPRASTFAQLEAETMGHLGTPADGFDKAMTPLVTALAQHAPQLATMDSSIKAATFTPGTVRKANYDPIGISIAKLAPVGDAILQEFGVQIPGVITCTQPKAMEQEPKPVEPGGGGGGPTPGHGPPPPPQPCVSGKQGIDISTRQSASVTIGTLAAKAIIRPWKSTPPRGGPPVPAKGK